MKPGKEEGAALRFLYRTVPGRGVLKVLTRPGISRAAGRFLDAPASRLLIVPFARKHAICLSDYLPERYTCFNDFFCRSVRPELRPLPADPELLIAPCDGMLTVYSLSGETILPVKQSRYTLGELLHGDRAAMRFTDGTALVFRLCVNHYHRFCYVDDGSKGANIFLPGVLHTVRPIALEQVPVFVRNSREYTLMETERFGTVCQIEVGALLVGKIVNLHGAGPIRRGTEKGRFLYGGSTVILLLEKGRVQLDEGLLTASAEGREIPVRMGQPLGRAVSLSKGFNQ